MSFSEIDLISLFPFEDDDPILVDVGAHHGSSSRWFALQGWRVLAFEPEPGNRAAFERNMRHHPNVTCLALAVSDVDAERVPFFVSREHYGIHSLRPFHETHEEALAVRTVRLDGILEKHNISSVTVLKIDVEGADFPALKGFNIERFKPEIVMLEFMDARTSSGFGYDHHAVALYMAERGYLGFVSEWAQVTEYAREGESTQPHRWIGCSPYPLDHEPVWGNLIFVPKGRARDFEKALQRYLRTLSRTESGWFRSAAQKIPGARRVYSFLKDTLD